MNLLSTWDPFKEMDDMRNQINQLMSQSFGSLSQPQLTTPIADVYTEGEGDKQTLNVEAHLPNFKEDEVDVSVDQGALLISAEHSDKEEDKDKPNRRYVMRESATSFYRRIGLPKNVDTDKINAEFNDGVLKVAVPFKELPKPKKISVKKSSK